MSIGATQKTGIASPVQSFDNPRARLTREETDPPLHQPETLVRGHETATPTPSPRQSQGSLLSRVATRTMLVLALSITSGMAVAAPVDTPPPLQCQPVAAAPVENTQDYGDAKEVARIKPLVHHKIGHPVNVSVSNNWALSKAYAKEDDFVVLLHKTGPHGGQWHIVAYDGGAYGPAELKAYGVPDPDIPNLQKTYQ